MITQYLVEWEEVGYYAKAQPTYTWCFTHDPKKAATYKKVSGAETRACGNAYGSGHNNRTYRIVTVDGNFDILHVGQWIKHEDRMPVRSPKGPAITLAMLMKGKKQ